MWLDRSLEEVQNAFPVTKVSWSLFFRIEKGTKLFDLREEFLLNHIDISHLAWELKCEG